MAPAPDTAAVAAAAMANVRRESMCSSLSARRQSRVHACRPHLGMPPRPMRDHGGSPSRCSLVRRGRPPRSRAASCHRWFRRLCASASSHLTSAIPSFHAGSGPLDRAHDGRHIRVAYATPGSRRGRRCQRAISTRRWREREHEGDGPGPAGRAPAAGGAAGAGAGRRPDPGQGQGVRSVPDRPARGRRRAAGAEVAAGAGPRDRRRGGAHSGPASIASARASASASHGSATPAASAASAWPARRTCAMRRASPAIRSTAGMPSTRSRTPAIVFRSRGRTPITRLRHCCAPG